jgi:hypothetical protein
MMQAVADQRLTRGLIFGINRDISIPPFGVVGFVKNTFLNLAYASF